jgi:hypothetical protein
LSALEVNLIGIILGGSELPLARFSGLKSEGGGCGFLSFRRSHSYVDRLYSKKKPERYS